VNEREPRPRPADRPVDPFGLDISDLLPDVGADERDTGWGGTSGADRDDLRRFLDEKPPHHL
jgi:hypothetical protein